MASRMASNMVFTQRFRDGETIFDGGTGAPVMFMILRGKVRVFRRVHGIDVDLGVLGPGELVGDVAFLTSQHHSGCAEAVGPTELWLIGSDDVEGFVHDPLAHRLLVTLATRLRAMDEQYERLTMVAERHKKCLESIEYRGLCSKAR